MTVQDWIHRYPSSSSVRLDSVTCRASAVLSLLSATLRSIFGTDPSQRWCMLSGRYIGTVGFARSLLLLLLLLLAPFVPIVRSD